MSSHPIPRWMPRYQIAEALGYPPGVPMIPAVEHGDVFVNPTIESLRLWLARTKDPKKQELIVIGIKSLRYWKRKSQTATVERTWSERSGHTHRGQKESGLI
jgi:hypothetical protein